MCPSIARGQCCRVPDGTQISPPKASAEQRGDVATRPAPSMPATHHRHHPFMASMAGTSHPPLPYNKGVQKSPFPAVLCRITCEPRLQIPPASSADGGLAGTQCPAPRAARTLPPELPGPWYPAPCAPRTLTLCCPDLAEPPTLPASSLAAACSPSLPLFSATETRVKP